MFKYIRLSVVLLFSFYYGVSISHSELLQVPEEFASIPLALSAAQANDTILLAPGQYNDVLTITLPLTISSHYLLSNDSNTIHQTIWNVVFTGPAIQVTSASLHLMGLKFTTTGEAQPGRVVLNAAASDIIIENCRMDGSFSSNSAVVTCDYGTKFKALSSRFMRRFEAHSYWIRCIQTGNIQLDQCQFIDSTSGGAFALSLSGDSIRVKDCWFDSPGRAMQVTAHVSLKVAWCVFRHHRSDCLWLFGGTSENVIANCLFDSLYAMQVDHASLLTLNSFARDARYQIYDCQFLNCVSGNGNNFAGLIGTGNSSILSFRRCIFHNMAIDAFPMFNATRVELFDSCSFVDIAITGQYFEIPTPPINGISYCDFIRCAGTFVLSDANVFPAPNCYWGAANGPIWQGNPGGSGMSLVDNVNPVPWRTTPVFPETGVREQVTSSSPTHYSLSAYPNPFNSTLYIHWSGSNPPLQSITVFDALGRTVHNLQITELRGNRFLWNPTNLANGVYYLLPNTIEQRQVKAIPVIYLK